jgi:predicted O-linked N-acetylglucosamine transferase (SPINDLY family)
MSHDNAVRPAPGDPRAAFVRAFALHRSGRPAEAGAIYRQILAAQPDHFDALHFLAVAEYECGRCEQAERLFQAALAMRPGSVGALSNYSLVLHALGRFEEAVAACDRALGVKPDAADAICNRANALRSLGRLGEALAGADAALALNSDYPQAHDVRGAALVGLRRFEDALAAYDRAVALNPNYAEAWSNRGGALLGLSRLNEAVASFDRALTLQPRLADALLGRATALLQLKRPDGALADCRRALEIEPHSPGALTFLGACYEKRGDLSDAISLYERALAIKPDFGPALSSRIFALDFAPGADFAVQQAARADWWRQVGAPIAAAAPQDHDNDVDPERRLVLGYVSGDFRRHSAALIFRPVLENHDRSRFEIVCYSCSAFEDDTTRAFRRIADRWRDANQLADERLAEQIRADKIDILIDLSGHTAGNRLEVFARKPAPVQVTAWGHATGTGLPTIDYFFGDPVLVPSEARPLFAEEIYDLPCMVTVEPAPEGSCADDPPMLRNGCVTFGVFNRISKISAQAIEIWAQIVRKTDRSRLLIKHSALDERAVRHALERRLSGGGIPLDRVDLLGGTPRRAHLEAFGQVDVSLDPFPQNGGVSTWESLQMGVPVVAKLGNAVASRLSASILSSMGLGEWIAETESDYIEIATRFAAMPEHLRALRRDLPARIAASPAGDCKAFTREVDRAYRTMWRRYCERMRMRAAAA